MNQTVNNVVTIVGVLILAILLLGGPLMLLWDWLMPTLFGLPEITFWQACGLQLLATLLFKPTSLKTNKD
jgi:hypothetical protein